MQNLLISFRHPQKIRFLTKFTFFSTLTLQFLFVTLFPYPQSLATNRCRPIGDALEEILHQPHLQRTRWGINIQKMSATGQWRSLYTRNAQQLFLPASTAKLFTTTVLAKVFAPTYRIETPYFGQGTRSHLKQLRIVGQGDPSILSPQLTQLARDLKTQGVRRIDRLLGEDSSFRGPWIIPSWEWEDLLTADGVPITSLSFSQNSLPLRLSPGQIGQPLTFEWLDGKPLSPLIIENLSTTVQADQPEYIHLERNLAGTTLTIHGQLRVGASPDVSYVAIAYPTQYFLHRLRLALQAEGIQVKHLTVASATDVATDALNTDSLSTDERKLGALLSPPLANMLKTINQSSNNFYTESLLRHVALKISSQQSVTPQQSMTTLKESLTSMGIEPNSYFLKDGSGLSRQNLVSPESLTATLHAALQWSNTGDSKKFQTLKDSLAIAGQAGTLKQRFQDSPVAGKLFGKTGTLNGAVTLAGFMAGPKKSTVVLSLMANQSDQPTSVLRQTIDEIVLEIAQSQSCSGSSPDEQTKLKKSLYNLKS